MHPTSHTQHATTSISYWQQTAQEPLLETQLPHEADVVVVGGGIVGVATCYWLAKAGHSPLLLERSYLASGATGRNGGIVAIGLAEGYPSAIKRHGAQVARAILNMTLENRSLLRQVIQEEQLDCQYRETGHIGLALSEAQMDKLKSAASAKEESEVVTHLLTRQEVQEHIRTRLGPQITGGVLWPQGGLVHSARLVHELAHAAQRHGARLRRGTVTHLTPQGQKIAIQTTGGIIHARKVIVATNAWTGDLLPTFRTAITPIRGQMIAYEPIPERIFDAGIFAAYTQTEEYWQQTLDGSIVIGGCRAAAPDRDVNIREQTTSMEVQQALEGIMPALFPDLSHLRVTHRWGGTMAFTRDYMPIVDEVPDMPGVWAAGGFNGHGMPFGMRVGQLLAATVDRGRTDPTLAPLTLARTTLQA